jgi:hypothetical protein
MGVPTSEFGYTLATARRADHEVHKEHVEALGGLIISAVFYTNIYHFITIQLNVHYNNIHHSLISRVMTSEALLM